MDFEWEVDIEGYSFAERDPPFPDEESLNLMNPRPSLLGWDSKPWRLVGRSGRKKKIRPLNKHPALFSTFAMSSQTPEGLLNFVSRYGPLTEFGRSEYEPVTETIEHAKNMHDYIVAAGATGRMADLMGREGMELPGIHAAIVWNKTSKMPSIRVTPRSLLQALWVQLSFGLSSGVSARECNYCGVIFTAGPGTGRRGDSQYCSKDHQILNNSLKRSLRGKG
jgi:hypothetical protein